MQLYCFQIGTLMPQLVAHNVVAPQRISDPSLSGLGVEACTLAGWTCQLGVPCCHAVACTIT